MESQFNAAVTVSIAEDIAVREGGVLVLQDLEKIRKNIHNAESYQRTQMQKDIIIQKLKEQGCRITKQRKMLLDIIIEEKCSSCKEIYYKASKRDEKIGSATVYRMITTLEEIGAISRRNMYKIACGEECELDNVCTIVFDDNTSLQLSANKWNHIIQTGLTVSGYIKDQNVRSVIAKPCECIK